jgi:hypothetical protein
LGGLSPNYIGKEATNRPSALLAPFDLIVLP